MSYNMMKLHTKDWEQAFNGCRKRRLKLLFNPFYSRKRFVSEVYAGRLGKAPDLDNPTTFTEKINASKLNRKCQKIFSQYADKHKVRFYVADKIGNKYLVPEFLYTKKLTSSDIDKLPDKFVLKTTNGSGTNYIVKNKNKENISEVISYINWLSTIKYGYMSGEFFYNKIRRGIIAEKLLIDKSGNIPDDLKCFCFKDNNNKRRKIFYVERVIGDDRYRIMFDENWKQVYYPSNFKTLKNYKLKKPKNYDEIIDITDKLSEDFNFVRVDLFQIDNKLYFCELTFNPTSGCLNFQNKEDDLLWGSWIGDDFLR